MAESESGFGASGQVTGAVARSIPGTGIHGFIVLALPVFNVALL
jgi:hypothetical protein